MAVTSPISRPPAVALSKLSQLESIILTAFVMFRSGAVIWSDNLMLLVNVATESPLVLYFCQLFLFLLCFFQSSGDNKRLVFLVKSEKIRRKHVQLMQSIQSEASFCILCFD